MKAPCFIYGDETPLLNIEKAFGRKLDEYYDLLYMPETFIIYRLRYEHNLTESWHEKFHSLDVDELTKAKKIIEANKFSEKEIANVGSENVRELLKFYLVRR